jgi:hypothetical protein
MAIKQYICILLFCFPLFLLAQKNNETNKKANTENKLDNKYSPKDNKAYGNASSDKNAVGDYKNYAFFNLGALARATLLFGYERELNKRINVNAQLGIASRDYITSLINESEINTNKNPNKIAIRSLLNENANEFEASLGLAFAGEFKFKFSRNGNNQPYFVLGYRSANYKMSDTRSWILSKQVVSSTGSVNVAQEVDFKVNNRFIYFGIGRNLSADGERLINYGDLGIAFGFKFTKYNANFESKGDYVKRTNLNTNNLYLYESEYESVYTGGVYGSPLKSSNFIFLISYRFGIGF